MHHRPLSAALACAALLVPFALAFAAEAPAPGAVVYLVETACTGPHMDSCEVSAPDSWEGERAMVDCLASIAPAAILAGPFTRYRCEAE